jgi:hypothetical protein
MPDEIPNLWPEDIGRTEKAVTPVSILKAAASQLGQRTSQLVRASVHTVIRGDDFFHGFWLEVPSLEYQYKLFEVHHAVDSFYPLYTDQWSKSGQLILGSEEDVKEYLKTVFATEKTKRLVETLLQQIRS